MAGYPVHYLGTRPPPNRPSVLAYSTRVRKQILREDAFSLSVTLHVGWDKGMYTGARELGSR